MSNTAMKRFYEQATIVETPGGFAVLLDEKPLNTPAKNPVTLPNAAMAEAVAKEWDAQKEFIDKNSLPLMGYTSLTLDVVIPRREEVIDELLEYGETDLLFYREDSEQALETQQHERWQPWVEKAQTKMATQYLLASGIMPVNQPAENKSKHTQAMEKYSAWQLALLAGIVKPTTSLLLSLAFMDSEMDAEELFELSRLEEHFNRDKWGEDAEAKTRSDQLYYELQQAQIWRDLLE